MTAESVSAGTFSYGTGLGWDAAGRRSSLSIGAVNYGFIWQADGGLTYASNPTGSGSYGYNTAGLLTSRSVGNRQTSIASRDGTGRPLSINTTVNLLTALSESLTWSGDGLLATHTLNRVGDFTDSRVYSYANLSRRLTQEQLGLNASTLWTNSFVYDKGIAGGPGLLTSAGQLNGSSGLWTSGADTLSRVSAETNNSFAYSAYGHANGQSTLKAWLDGQPISITALGTNAMQWRAGMDLSSGTHQLKVAALHPSGFYTAWATNSFTNNLAYESSINTFDAAGFVTNRVWKSPSGAVERTQMLVWDARGRLHSVTERDANTNGQNFTIVYDALGRRLQTTQVLVTNGVVYPNPPIVLAHYFDPLYEFQEMGVSQNAQTTWKLMGPDLDGDYGSQNGTGGFEGVSPYLNLFDPTIADANGNVLGVVTNGIVNWNNSRLTGYGAVPGYRPPALGSSDSLTSQEAWRDRATESIGLVYLGANWYDPVDGQFMSPDPLGFGANTSLYEFCAGNPLGYWDSDGRLGKNGQHILFDSNWQRIGTYSDYDAFYLGGRKAAMNMTLLNPVTQAGMPPTDRSIDAFAGKSFRMEFGDGLTGAADFAINTAFAPVNALNEVAESSRAAGEASVTGEDRGFAYTRATVSFIAAALMFEAPMRGSVDSAGLTGDRVLPNVGGIRMKVNPNADELGSINASEANTPNMLALVRGARVNVRIRAADFTPEEQALIRARYEVANARIATGQESAIIGNQVRYSYYKSQRFVRDTMFPGRPISSVRIPEGYNVDEFVSRQHGGRQVPGNQSLLLERINTALGPLEQNAVAHLPRGSVIQGFDVQFY